MNIFEYADTYSSILMNGLLLTIQVSFTSFCIGLLIAACMAPLSVFGSKYTQTLVKVYLDVFRGLPELLIIFLFYYGGTVALTKLTGHYFEVNAITAGITALSMVASAYLTEILRAALLTIDKGQWEAAYSLGLSPIKTFRLVILHQVVKKATSGMANQWLVSLKESALVSVIGLEELMRVTVVSSGSTQQPLIFYTIAAVLYLVVTSVSQGLISSLGYRAQRRRG